MFIFPNVHMTWRQRRISVDVASTLVQPCKNIIYPLGLLQARRLDSEQDSLILPIRVFSGQLETLMTHFVLKKARADVSENPQRQTFHDTAHIILHKEPILLLSTISLWYISLHKIRLRCRFENSWKFYFQEQGNEKIRWSGKIGKIFPERKQIVLISC